MSKWYAEITVGVIVEADTREDAEDKAVEEVGGTELIEIGDLAPLGAHVHAQQAQH